jgi:hypothetical protein
MKTIVRSVFGAFMGVLLSANVAGAGQTPQKGLIVGNQHAAAPIKGAPFSGEAITTVKMTMFDGTKIERTVTNRLYRDSAGRLRREQTVIGLEALDPSDDFRSVATIVDPVADVLITLSPGSKIAHRMPLAAGMADPQATGLPRNWPVKRESLGTKDIDGISAAGQRITTTIPIGSMGNNKPIDIIDERWESVELKVLVRSLHRDPRSGDIEYTLTKISRMEPPASLFTIPAGYKIMEAAPVRK